MTETERSTHVKDIVSKAKAISTDVAEDVDAAQPEANIQRTEADDIATHTGIARTQEESARHTQNVTMKWLPSPK